jgi:hypothetical protein
MDETAVSVRGGTLKTHHPRWPTKLNLDGNAASHRALCVLRQENPIWQSVEIRSRRYLNNIIEQDHRAIKRRCAPMLAMKSFRTAATTLAGVELAHRIRKSQFTFGPRGPHQFSSLKHAWARALMCNDDVPTVRGGSRKAPLRRNDAGVRERTGSHARQHVSLPAVRREQVVVCSNACRFALLPRRAQTDLASKIEIPPRPSTGTTLVSLKPLSAKSKLNSARVRSRPPRMASIVMSISIAG